MLVVITWKGSDLILSDEHFLELSVRPFFNEKKLVRLCHVTALEAVVQIVETNKSWLIKIFFHLSGVLKIKKFPFE
jgi:hypothetical protein